MCRFDPGSGYQAGIFRNFSRIPAFLIFQREGRLRVNALEYLYLKNKKEYYVDVIYYKNKKVDYDITYDSFLIDKEYTHINSLTNFARVYGYDTHVDLIKDSQIGNCHIYVDLLGQYYLNKYISYTKEDFINSVITVEKMIIES